MERMKVLSQNQDECSEAELSNRFKSVELQTAELAAATPEVAVALPPIISHYVDDASFTYQDFARRGAENINTFRIQDYSWEDHGYSLVDGWVTAKKKILNSVLFFFFFLCMTCEQLVQRCGHFFGRKVSRCLQFDVLYNGRH